MKTVWDYAVDILAPEDDSWRPEAHQIPPAGDWFVWLLFGGRGAGKTAAAARYIHDHVHGVPCLPGVPGGHWIGIIAPTLGDAVTSCVYGPSGLRAHDPGVKVRQTAGGATVKWTNGAEAKLFGASTPDDIERLRSGGNRCVAWIEELAAFRQLDEAWQHMRYGLRVGPRPHAIVSTTPKNRALIKKLVKDAANPEDPERPEVVLTRATTNDNPHLDSRVKRMLFEDYGHTRLGRQELYAEILEDVEGALWTPADIEGNRVVPINQPDTYSRVVVGVDPQIKEGGDETGIVVAGKCTPSMWKSPDKLPGLENLDHGFVLGDYTVNGPPPLWARMVVNAFNDFEANLVVAEINNGGEMVKHTLHTLEPSLPVKVVHATRGKTKRAEPISTLYQQRRVHHVGIFPTLEDQMLQWDSLDPDQSWSPDRMDALVWALNELLVGGGQSQKSSMIDTRLRGRR